jgi:hypothetical protein
VTLLEPQREGIPLPVPTATSQPFWDGCGRGELLYQRCGSCGRPVFNPASVCRWCGGADLEWLRSAGEGSIYSWTVAWRPQRPSFQTPYVPIIVDMDEGFQMLSNLIGCEPDAAHGGMRVIVEFHSVGGDITLPYFRPAAP